MTKPLVAITSGDPCGIGPEITARVALNPAITEKSLILVLGDARVMADALQVIGSRARLEKVSEDQIRSHEYSRDALHVLDLANSDPAAVTRGEVGVLAGKASIEAIEAVTRLALDQKIDAFVTAPVNKESMKKAGLAFSGEADLMAHMSGAKTISAMVVSSNLRVFQVTAHISLRQALEVLDKEKILSVTRVAHEFLSQTLGKPPRLAVAGLNPHAGEGGTMGTEEIDYITPAIKAAVAEGIDAQGPVPSDVVFRKALDGHYDAVIALYHDQANIPLKLMESYRNVVVTAGLPVIRTSVAHGTAFDIAWKGIADHRALEAAVETASDLAKGRRTHAVAGRT
jgi:4-hydroxythreonine-4-phosphate dehydrogenase